MPNIMQRQLMQNALINISLQYYITSKNNQRSSIILY